MQSGERPTNSSRRLGPVLALLLLALPLGGLICGGGYLTSQVRDALICPCKASLTLLQLSHCRAALPKVYAPQPQPVTGLSDVNQPFTDRIAPWFTTCVLVLPFECKPLPLECLQVSGPAAQLLSSLQHSSLAAAKFGCIRAGQSGISAAAAAPILTLRHTAAATSRSVSAIGNAGRALLRGLKPKAKPKWAAPRSHIAHLASGMLSGRSDASVAAPGGSAMPEGAGVNAKHLRPSPERGASPAASAKVAAAGSSPAAGSDTRSMSAAVVQLQQQVAALHDEVAALRGSLAGLSGGPAAEEVRDRAWPHSGGTVCVFCSGKGSGEGNT